MIARWNVSEATTLNNLGCLRLAGREAGGAALLRGGAAVDAPGGRRVGRGDDAQQPGIGLLLAGREAGGAALLRGGAAVERQVGDVSGEATTLNNLGSVYDSLGEKQEALRYYEEALPLMRAGGRRVGRGDDAQQPGMCLRLAGREAGGAALLRGGAALIARWERVGEATTLNNLGSVYDSLGEKQEALRYYEEALPLRRQVGDRWRASLATTSP